MVRRMPALSLSFARETSRSPRQRRRLMIRVVTVALLALQARRRGKRCSFGRERSDGRSAIVGSGRFRIAPCERQSAAVTQLGRRTCFSRGPASRYEHAFGRLTREEGCAPWIARHPGPRRRPGPRGPETSSLVKALVRFPAAVCPARRPMQHLRSGYGDRSLAPAKLVSGAWAASSLVRQPAPRYWRSALRITDEWVS